MTVPVAPPVVIDTDVVSYLFKQDTRAALYRPHLLHRTSVVSFMTVAELDAWAEVNNWGSRRSDRLQRFLSGYVIHFPDRRQCRLWAATNAGARRAGRPVGVADAWITATALRYGVPLITHNPSDFAGVRGLTLISEAGP